MQIVVYPDNHLHRLNSSNRLNGLNGLNGLLPTTRDLRYNKKSPNA